MRQRRRLPPGTLSAPSTCLLESGGSTRARWSAGAVGRSIASSKLSVPTRRASRKPCSCSGPGRPGEDCPQARRRTSQRTPRRQTLRFSRSGNPSYRGVISDPLGLAGTFREEARAFGGKSEPRPGAGGGPAIEQGVEMSSMRRHRRSPDDGNSRPGVPALRRSRRSRISVGGRCLLTRRAKAKSTRHAVVVRFSRTRRRYERQGLLVEPQALAEAQRELETE